MEMNWSRVRKKVLALDEVIEKERVRLMLKK